MKNYDNESNWYDRETRVCRKKKDKRNIDRILKIAKEHCKNYDYDTPYIPDEFDLYEKTNEGKILGFITHFNIASNDMTIHGKGYVRAEHNENVKNIEYHKRHIETIFQMTLATLIKMSKVFDIDIDHELLDFELGADD